jgi:Subtilisin inhibitor-like
MKFSRVGGTLLALALPFAVSGVAGACPVHALTLTVTSPIGDSKSVELTCEPAGGTHPNANRACAEILAAQGDFDALPGDPDQVACTMEYRPTTAAVEGTWDGEHIVWQREFSNDCTLHSATGAVFRF